MYLVYGTTEENHVDMNVRTPVWELMHSFRRYAVVFRRKFEGDISHSRASRASTSKVGISTFKRIAFSSGVFRRSWRMEVLSILFELFSRDSFMSKLTSLSLSLSLSSFRVHSETRPSTCTRAIDAGEEKDKERKSKQGRALQFKIRQDYTILCIYECPLQPPRDRDEESAARICLARDAPLPFIGSTNLELCYIQTTLHAAGGWDSRKSRKDELSLAFLSSRNVIAFSCKLDYVYHKRVKFSGTLI